METVLSWGTDPWHLFTLGTQVTDSLTDPPLLPFPSPVTPAGPPSGGPPATGRQAGASHLQPM